MLIKIKDPLKTTNYSKLDGTSDLSNMHDNLLTLLNSGGIIEMSKIGDTYTIKYYTKLLPTNKADTSSSIG